MTSKYILIAGGTGGIGSEIAATLLRDGYSVVVTGTSEDSIRLFKKKAPGREVKGLVVDFMDENSIEGLISALDKDADSFLWFINAVGFIDKEEDNKSIEKTLRINTLFPIKLELLLLPKISNMGGMINISSTAGIWGNPEYPIYSASKSAINTFSSSIAKKVANSGKKVITICPGPTNTKMREKVFGDATAHQHPSIIANTISQIIKGETSYNNGDLIVIRDGKESLGEQY